MALTIHRSDAPLVEIFRELDVDRPCCGFVVAENEQFVVVHQVSDRFDLDGYRALRKEDIEGIDTDFERRDVVERALAIKQLEPVVPAGLDLSSMRRLMESAQAASGILVIARERVHDDEVEVGTIRMTSDDTYVLRWMTISAEWDNDDRPFRYRDVTYLEFGTEYEQTLLAVARSREGDAAA